VSAQTTKRTRLAVFLAALTAGVVLAAFLIITAGPATAKEFATLHPLEGAVEVQRGQGAFSAGSEGQTLQAGDTVRTGTDGRTEIEYFDGSITRLDHDTSFRLRELASYPDTTGSKIIEGEQSEGRTFERVTELTDSKSRFDVDTPTATASVRGTEYVLTTHPDGSTEIWVLPDDQPGTSSVVLILDDGTEIIVSEGQGVIVHPDGSAEGPFTLTAEQLEDGFIHFNVCLDDPDLEECQTEVEAEVVEQPNEEPETSPPPPPAPPAQEPQTTQPNDQGAGGGGGGGGPQRPPSDRRSVVITLSWSRGPTNLDLHVLTPDADEDEGGEVWSGNSCLSRSDGSCWAFASGDAVAFGVESVTLRPLGSPEDGDWLGGSYRIWVENTSCQDGTFADSDAVVTVSRGGDESVSLPVSGASGDRTLETWGVASVFMDRDGSMAIAGTQTLFGEACGPPPVEVVLMQIDGAGEGDVPARQAIQPAPASGSAGGHGIGTEVAVDPGIGGHDIEVQEPPPPPVEEPPPSPEPEPSPSPSPSPTPDQPVGAGAVLPDPPAVTQAAEPAGG
jgi:FecR-like protein